jgi:hypothetical protein
VNFFLTVGHLDVRSAPRCIVAGFLKRSSPVKLRMSLRPLHPPQSTTDIILVLSDVLLLTLQQT